MHGALTTQKHRAGSPCCARWVHLHVEETETCKITQKEKNTFTNLHWRRAARHRAQPVAGGVPGQLHQNVDLVVTDQLS